MDYSTLISELKITNDNNRRNEIALILMDMRCNEAIPALIEIISNPLYANNIGTLIYALENLDCANYLLDILHIIFHGNWEASNNLLSVFKEKYKYMNETDKIKCRDMFIEERARAEDTIEMINDTLSKIIV